MAALQPETIIHAPGIEITNTLLATIFTDAILVLLLILIVKNLNKIPNLFQVAIESAIEYFYNLTNQIAGKNTEKIFPWFASFFIFIFIANLTGLLPGFGSIGFYQSTSHGTFQEETVKNTSHTPETPTEHLEEENHATNTAATQKESSKESEHTTQPESTHGETHFVPLLRGITSDFNVTLALATISIIATHIIAVKTTGFKSYISRFLSFNPVLLFVGILELVSELTKLFSLSFRLFGNIYAGEVVLMTISGIFAFLAPIPFLLLEFIVALVQALVFSMLTMVFMSILATPHHTEEH